MYICVDYLQFLQELFFCIVLSLCSVLSLSASSCVYDTRWSRRWKNEYYFQPANPLRLPFHNCAFIWNLERMWRSFITRWPIDSTLECNTTIAASILLSGLRVTILVMLFTHTGLCHQTGVMSYQYRLDSRARLVLWWTSASPWGSSSAGYKDNEGKGAAPAFHSRDMGSLTLFDFMTRNCVKLC